MKLLKDFNITEKEQEQLITYLSNRVKNYIFINSDNIIRRILEPKK